MILPQSCRKLLRAQCFSWRVHWPSAIDLIDDGDKDDDDYDDENDDDDGDGDDDDADDNDDDDADDDHDDNGDDDKDDDDNGDNSNYDGDDYYYYFVYQLQYKLADGEESHQPEIDGIMLDEIQDTNSAHSWIDWGAMLEMFFKS